MPLPDFQKSAQVFDDVRLEKQRIEAYAILRILKDPSYKKSLAWRNHSAMTMWRNYEWALVFYYHELRNEWIRRGNQESLPEIKDIKFMPLIELPEHVDMPSWMGNRKLHSSHRAALLAENLPHYSQFNWPEVPAEMQWSSDALSLVGQRSA